MDNEMKYWDVTKAMCPEERKRLRKKISNLPMNDDRFDILRLLETIHQEELKHQQKGEAMAQDPKEYQRRWVEKQTEKGRKRFVGHLSLEASQALAELQERFALKAAQVVNRALVVLNQHREFMFDDAGSPQRPQIPEASTPPDRAFGYFGPTAATYAHATPERPRMPPEAIQALSLVEAMASQVKALQGRLDALERQGERTSTRPKPDPDKPRGPGVYKMAPEEKAALLQFLAVAYAKDGKRWNRRALYQESKNNGLQVHATFGGFTNFITGEMENIKAMSENKDIFDIIKNNAEWR